MYKLKRNVADFVVVDGPFAGRRYQGGTLYTEVPPREAKKFEEIGGHMKKARARGEAIKPDTAPPAVLKTRRRNKKK